LWRRVIDFAHNSRMTLHGPGIFYGFDRSRRNVYKDMGLMKSDLDLAGALCACFEFVRAGVGRYIERFQRGPVHLSALF
jgi:hypothetical protein